MSTSFFCSKFHISSHFGINIPHFGYLLEYPEHATSIPTREKKQQSEKHICNGQAAAIQSICHKTQRHTKLAFHVELDRFHPKAIDFTNSERPNSPVASCIQNAERLRGRAHCKPK